MWYRTQQIQLIVLSLGILNCSVSLLVDAFHCKDVNEHANKLHFGLVRHCQRSKQNLIAFENTQSLAECVALAKRVKGLALNYAPVSRRDTENLFANISNENDRVFYFNSSRQLRRRHFWQQPEEFFNCHILECPENATFRTMTNDSRFDYFSLYGKSLVATNYTCIPQVGIFQLNTNALNYRNAVKSCATNFSGALAHITSGNRTNSLAKLLANHNENRNFSQHNIDRRINLAYVGLHFNRSWVDLPSDFLTPTNISLKCYLYRAWSPGHPKSSGTLANSSCVALSISHAWITVECEMKLPFICEFYTSNQEDDDNKEYENFEFMKKIFPDECFLN